MSDGQLDYLRILVLAEDTARYGSRLLGQHGLSYLLEARRGGKTQRIIVDVGQNSSALKHNIGVLGVNVADVDMIVMTHCHYDHTVGISSLLSDIGKSEVPVVGHPDSFRLNFVTDPYIILKGLVWQDRPSNIESSGGRLVLTRDPLQLMPGLHTTGEIPRVTDYEDVGMALSTIQDGRVVRDDMLDDISVVASVAGCGTVLITGCSHAGIVNVVKHAVSMFPGQPLEGIIGGFHLIEASDARIRKTVDELAQFNPRWICAGHCTGFRAQMVLASKFGSGFSQMNAGTELTIAPRA